MNNLKIYLATSCLQTRPMLSTINELLELNPYGLQLTAGNILYPNLKQHLITNNINYLQHHNFSWKHYARRDTWTVSEEGKLQFNAPESNSVHPPMFKDINHPKIFWEYIEDNIKNNYSLPVFETMYPPDYILSNDNEINKIMDMDLKIAVDISHIFIQVHRRALSENTWERIKEYKNIEEIHVSSNKGTRDTHQPLTEDTFGLDWAKAYASNKQIPIVLECYMHRMNFTERQEQIKILTL